jgi:SWI/SNF-related matrix-associated actin-dependent regulator 1 of chromatin subfamily A
LADEMGLGKTAQVVSFLGTLFERKIFGPHLIVVPSSTLDNWMREIRMWCPALTAIAYTGSQAERRSLQYDILGNENLNIIVTTYNIATGNGEEYVLILFANHFSHFFTLSSRKFLRSTRCRTLFLDEGHMIKNDNSARTKHLKKLGIEFKILITGTPLQNNLMELLSLLTFIMPDVFAPAYDTFSAIFDLKNSNNRLEDEVSKRRLERASKIMNPFVLRRRKDDVLNDIPPKTRRVVNCSMPSPQKTVYLEIMRDSRKQYLETVDAASSKKTKKNDTQKSAASLSNVMMQLRKAANHQLLMRKLYTDEMLPAIAKDIMKVTCRQCHSLTALFLKQELEFMDSNYDYVVEDLGAMSDFQLHKLCVEYPKVHKYQLSPDDWMNSGKVF